MLRGGEERIGPEFPHLSTIRKARRTVSRRDEADGGHPRLRPAVTRPSLGNVVGCQAVDRGL